MFCKGSKNEIMVKITARAVEKLGELRQDFAPAAGRSRGSVMPGAGAKDVGLS
jgi:hypothetical protein